MLIQNKVYILLTKKIISRFSINYKKLMNAIWLSRYIKNIFPLNKQEILYLFWKVNDRFWKTSSLFLKAFSVLEKSFSVLKENFRFDEVFPTFLKIFLWFKNVLKKIFSILFFFYFENLFDSDFFFFLNIELFCFDFEELFFVARFGFCTTSYIIVT